MQILFSDAFVKPLKKYSSIKKAIKTKVDMIIKGPVALGEPLKGNLRGFYSASVRRNFLVIYLYCKACRNKGDEGVVRCLDCDQCPDETIKFIDLGPHDPTYWK
jgi:mRNA-degrading endonuclease YafQ of YafQ-DinJ toxin-antitoxin module